MIAYNLVWWVPVLLVVVKIFDYRTGFYAFLATTAIRAGVNLYRNNILSAQQGAGFPLRSP